MNMMITSVVYDQCNETPSFVYLAYIIYQFVTSTQLVYYRVSLCQATRSLQQCNLLLWHEATPFKGDSMALHSYTVSSYLVMDELIDMNKWHPTATTLCTCIIPVNGSLVRRHACTHNCISLIPRLSLLLINMRRVRVQDHKLSAWSKLQSPKIKITIVNLILRRNVNHACQVLHYQTTMAFSEPISTYNCQCCPSLLTITISHFLFELCGLDDCSKHAVGIVNRRKRSHACKQCTFTYQLKLWWLEWGIISLMEYRRHRFLSTLHI